MVEKNGLVENIKSTYYEFINFLNDSLNSIKNTSDLEAYIKYVVSKEQFILDCLAKSDTESISFLDSCFGGLSRYFSEFNWFINLDFYNESKRYLLKLNVDVQTLNGSNE